MEKYKIDVSVLLIFFIRVEIFKKTFEQIKLARPSKLFLYQDGPRSNNTRDLENIRKCREIAEDIDWECDVYKFYQEKNVGCDPSEFIAQKWAFSHVDRCIVLEDDDVPSQSFFPFCAELLEKFKDDERINYICGLNHMEISEHVPYDYFFSTSGAIWGWASWKRVIDTWEEHYDFLDDEYTISIAKKLPDFLGLSEKTIVDTEKKRKRKIAFYENIFGANQRLNWRLNIVPTKNMISNIGLGEDATHFSPDYDLLDDNIKSIMYMKTYEIDFPIKHPKYVICDINHVNAVDFKLGRRLSFFEKTKRRFKFRMKLIKRRINLK
jgi:hypothetical protein